MLDLGIAIFFNSNINFLAEDSILEVSISQLQSGYNSLFCMSVSVLIFLGFSLVEMPVSGSGSVVPNQRLRVFVLTHG